MSKRDLPKVILVALVLLATLIGCAQAERLPAPVVERPVEKVVEREVAAPAPALEGALPSVAERMIIRTAELSLKVEDTEQALSQIKDIATSLGGYVASTNMQRVEEKLRGTVTIRVPAESFDAAMDQLKAIAIEVERESTSSQDVTEEYTDLNARLRNLEATEKELLELLTEVREKTGKAEDVLAVHRELSNIRGQIEQVKGRMQYLERMTALATINVELIPKEAIVRAGWAPGGTLQDALRGLVRALQVLADIAIWLVVFVLPVGLVVIIPVAIVILLWRRWRTARQAQKAGG